ncbi:MAG: hypothetical protein N2167_05695 [Flavobacteriales bacterium]|nr:hypothetical protein [Flavobacteriales bacterium]
MKNKYKYLLFSIAFIFGNHGVNHIYAQAVGIGDVVFTPNYLLHVHRNAAAGVVAQFTNTTTGNTTTDGFQINVNGNAVELNNRENDDFRFFTNNTERMSIEASGNVGIGTATPNASAILDLTSTTQGFLPPRVALTAKNAAAPITSPATGLMVYNTATAGTAPNNVTPGHYYWDGTRWQRFLDGPRFLSTESISGMTSNIAPWNPATTFTVIPGTIITNNWNAGDIVVVNYSGVAAYVSGTGYATVDVVPYVNGTPLGVGGYTRLELNSSTSAPWYIPYASVAVYTIPTTGSYTFDLRTARIAGTANVRMGGSSSEVTECIFTLTTIKP